MQTNWIGKYLQKTPIVRNLVKLSPGIDETAAGLKGLNRYKQKLLGSRLPLLYEEYMNAPTQAIKEKALVALRKEDMEHLSTVAATGAGAYVGATVAGEGVSRAVQYATRNVSKGILYKATGTKETDNKGHILTPKERINAALDKLHVPASPTLRNIAERWSLESKDTPQITASDATGLVSGALAVGLGSMTYKPALARLVGAQTFTHGTSNKSLQNILQKGIDPRYGAAEGGATRKIVRNAVAREYPFTSPSEVSTIVGLNTNVNVPVKDYIDNAIGRSYVGRGAPGRVAGGTYAYKVLQKDSPEVVAKLVEHIKAPMSWQMQAGERVANKQYLRALGGAIAGGILSPYRMLYHYPKAHEILYSTDPAKSNVVSGVMPFENFEKRFEPDPDDIVYGQSGHRTQRAEINKLGKKSITIKDKELNEHIAEALKQLDPSELAPIDPKHLSPGSATYRKILQNRTRNFRAYLKNPKGRNQFLGGLALAGAGAGLTALGGSYFIPVAKKIYNREQ